MKKPNQSSNRRLVLDSNIWISAFLIQGSVPAAVADRLIAGIDAGIISNYMLDEIGRSLARLVTAPRFKVAPAELSDYLDTLSTRLEIVVPLPFRFPLRDEKDLPIIGTALAGKATHLITGDRDLLEDGRLGLWLQARRVTIMRARDYLDLIDAVSIR